MKHDFLFLGLGIANGLLASALKSSDPSLKILFLEKDRDFMGSRTWSFHGSDLDEGESELVAPFVEHSWPSYEVRFRSHSRILYSGYRTITAKSFESRLKAAFDAESFAFGKHVTKVQSNRVECEDGSVFEATYVVDGRGWRWEKPDDDGRKMAFQKFLGLELLSAEPHGVSRPVVMEVPREQLGDYRFFYILPFDQRRLLIEETRYSDSPDFNQAELESGVLHYASAHELRITEVLRKESGVLPLPLKGALSNFSVQGGTSILSGVRAGHFHHTTSFSVPDAARFALFLTRAYSRDPNKILSLAKQYSLERWDSQAFLRLLNRLLFIAAVPDDRHKILERFYTMPAPLIERFCGSRLTGFDKVRLMSGKPPIPLIDALAVLRDRHGGPQC